MSTAQMSIEQDGTEPPADETDGGRPSALKMRLCAVSRQITPVSQMLRFVVGPDGGVVPDLKATLPGRGVWLYGSAARVQDAVKKRCFSRSFKRDVRVDAALVDQVDALLALRARESLALANKAGDVVTGFAKLEAALGAHTCLLLHAKEASADGVIKLDRRLRAIFADSAPDGTETQNIGLQGRALIANVLSGAEMDLALGRSNVVHAAVSAGHAGLAAAKRFRALVRFRIGDMEENCPSGASAMGV